MNFLHTFKLPDNNLAVYVSEQILGDGSKVYDVFLTGPVLLVNARNYESAFECAKAIQSACRGAA